MTTKKVLQTAKRLASKVNELQKTVDEKIIDITKGLLKNSGTNTLGFQEWGAETGCNGEAYATVFFKHGLCESGRIHSVTLTDKSFKFEIDGECGGEGVAGDLGAFGAVELLKVLVDIRGSVRDGLCSVTADGVVVPCNTPEQG